MNNLETLPKKKILSLFMTCGFPTLNHSKKIFNEMLSHQPDIIEFGLPFSDPMADGPIIQEANKLCLLYTSPSPRDTEVSRMPSSA